MTVTSLWTSPKSVFAASHHHTIRTLAETLPRYEPYCEPVESSLNEGGETETDQLR